MKVTSLSLLVGAKLAAAAASSARVVLFDVPPRSPAAIDTVSPTIARLVFAQRLGLAQDYSLVDAEPADVAHVDRYGGPQQYPLTGPKPSGPRLMIVVDGVEQADEIVSSNDDHLTLFDILPAPHPEDTKELISELLTHPGSETSDFQSRDVKGLLELSREAGNRLQSHGDTIVMQVTSLERSSPSERDQASARIRDVIAELRKDHSFQTVTIALMPPSHHCSKKSGATTTYGGLLRKRVSIKQSEVPLSSGMADADSSTAPQHKQSQPQSSPSQQFGSSASKPKKHLPYRFRSQDACEKQTANCTGHGACQLVIREPGEDGDEDEKLSYSCVCNKPVSHKTSSGGKKTTYFGGPACQKQDVVAPFWLLAGTTVVLLGVVSAGIGLLYAVGSEELPSVIGAGVSGPRAKQ